MQENPLTELYIENERNERGKKNTVEIMLARRPQKNGTSFNSLSLSIHYFL